MYAISVEFSLKPEAIDAFMPAMRRQARQSLHDEPGCLRFDVCVGVDEPQRVFLYELYESPAAFDAHLNSRHFQKFDAETRPMVVKKFVSRWIMELGDS